MADDGSGRHADNHCLLDEAEKQLYQPIVAKLNYLAHDRLDSRHATSCLAGAASAASLGDLQAATRVGRYLRKAPVAWQCRHGVVLCYADADWASDKISRRSTNGRVMTLGGGVLNSLGEETVSEVLRCRVGRVNCFQRSRRARVH